MTTRAPIASMPLLLVAAAVAAGPLNDEPAKLRAPVRLSLVEAIERATAEAPVGVAVEAELEWEHGRWVYSVEIAQGTAVLELELDAADGRIVDREEEDEDRSREAAARVTLAQAVAAAAAARPGQAVSAEILERDGGLVIEVRILAEGGTRAVQVDASTGVVVKP